MRNVIIAFFVSLPLGVAPVQGGATELKDQTLSAWNDYVQSVQTRMDSRLSGKSNFLWVDDDQARYRRVKQGEIEVTPENGNGYLVVPGGMIHDWIGAVFIPDSSIEQVLATLSDYEHYKDFYPPTVIDAQLLERSTDGDLFRMYWINKVLFVSAGTDTEWKSRSVCLAGHRAYNISYTTRVQEIEYGPPDRRILQADRGDGFIWRLYSFARYEERDGGVYLEMETLALTRAVPTSLHMLLMPLITRLSRSSLLLSLRQSRDAVRSSLEKPGSHDRVTDDNEKRVQYSARLTLRNHQANVAATSNLPTGCTLKSLRKLRISNQSYVVDGDPGLTSDATAFRDRH
jgi:hypothetical protein